jgi:hypothetical protein
MRASECRKKMGDTDSRARAPGIPEDFRLVDVPADPEDEDRGQQADREQCPPGDRLGQNA